MQTKRFRMARGARCGARTGWRAALQDLEIGRSALHVRVETKRRQAEGRSPLGSVGGRRRDLRVDRSQAGEAGTPRRQCPHTEPTRPPARPARRRSGPARGSTVLDPPTRSRSRPPGRVSRPPSSSSPRRPMGTGNGSSCSSRSTGWPPASRSVRRSRSPAEEPSGPSAGSGFPGVTIDPRTPRSPYIAAITSSWLSLGTIRRLGSGGAQDEDPLARLGVDVLRRQAHLRLSMDAPGRRV